MVALVEIKDAIYSWAAGHGILVDSAPQFDPGKLELVPFAPETAEYFRARKITRVWCDEEDNSITIFTRLPIAKTKKAVLRQQFTQCYSERGYTLTLSETRPHKIPVGVQSYGQLVPVHRRQGAICCGSSVGVGNQRNAGTLGALVKREGRDTIYGVSCNHVTGGCSTARPRTPIVVPGIQDVSADHPEITVVGYHESAAPMSQGVPSVFDVSQNRDLAYFEVPNSHQVCSQQGTGDDAYDTPTQFAVPAKGLLVKKWGRSTGLTTGQIKLVSRMDTPMEYNLESFYGPESSQFFKGTVYFTEVIYVQPSGRPFSLPGDSGSLVVTDDGEAERVVGMVIAGDRYESLVLPIEQVLKELNFTLLSRHNLRD